MATNAYFTLTNSNSSLSKKFTVSQTGYQPGITKQQSEKITLDGTPDISMGSLVKRHVYTVKVRETESRSGYGTLANLETFYSYNNPIGTPTNKLTLIDHYGVSHYCYMVGDYIPAPLSTVIEGGDAWFFVQCTFRLVS